MVRGTGAVFVACLATGCAKPLDTGVVLTPSTLSAADPTVCQRLLARARAGATTAQTCVARLGRDAEPMLAGADAAWSAGAALEGPSEARAARPASLDPASLDPASLDPASLDDVAPRPVSLPLDSFRRDPVTRVPTCRF